MASKFSTFETAKTIRAIATLSMQMSVSSCGLRFADLTLGFRTHGP